MCGFTQLGESNLENETQNIRRKESKIRSITQDLSNDFDYEILTLLWFCPSATAYFVT